MNKSTSINMSHKSSTSDGSTSDDTEEYIEYITTSECVHCEEKKKQKEFEVFLKHTLHGEMRCDLKKVNDLIVGLQDKLEQILRIEVNLEK